VQKAEADEEKRIKKEQENFRQKKAIAALIKIQKCIRGFLARKNFHAIKVYLEKEKLTREKKETARARVRERAQIRQQRELQRLSKFQQKHSHQYNQICEEKKEIDSNVAASKTEKKLTMQLQELKYQRDLKLHQLNKDQDTKLTDEELVDAIRLVHCNNLTKWI